MSEALTKSPTAVQAFAAVQSTPLTCAFRPPLGVAMVWIDQVVPFQTSAQVWVLSEPTASQEDEDVHDTSLSWAVVDPVGAGVVFRDQDVPFHCSANGNWFPLPSVKKPTAVHVFTDAHDTLIRKLCTAPAGLGVDCTVQLVPFHRSASETSVDPPPTASPTAVQAFAPLQDTPDRTLFEALGVVPTIQFLPFQVSTTASKTLPLCSSPPTAAQKFTNGQETVCRLLAIAPAGICGA